MQKLIVQPCSNAVARDNYYRTVQTQVLLTDIKNFLSAEQIKKILELFPDGKLKIWGVVDGKNGQQHTKWEKINIGDVVVFTWNNGSTQPRYNSGKTFE